MRLAFALMLLLPTATAARPKLEWLVHGSFLTPPDVHTRAGFNSKFELYVRPEIALRTWDNGTELVTYALIGVLKDRNRQTYNNKIQFDVGIEVRRKVSKAVRLSFGARWGTEQETGTGKRHSGFRVTMDAEIWRIWQPDWLTRRLPDGTRLILSGWGTFRYPAALDPFEKNNGLAQSSLKLAVDLPWRDTRVSVAPFVSVTAEWDIRKRVYNNYIEPALGVDVKFPLGDTGSLALGVKRAHQVRFVTATRATRTIGYLKWYKRF